jgi:branched-chain amino acid transport system substrate-binding protein
MSKVVILRIGNGSFDAGFDVTLEIRQNHQLIAPITESRLIPNSDIPEALGNYRKAYYHWAKSHPNLKITVPPDMILNQGEGDCLENLIEASHQLNISLNHWLDSSKLSLIQNRVLRNLGNDSDVRFFLQTSDLKLQTVPWEYWSFLREWWKNNEIALSLHRNPPQFPLQYPINILVVLGNISDIEESLRERVNESLQNLKDSIEKPKEVSIEILSLASNPPLSARTLHDILIDRRWDIVVYLGHSHSSGDGSRGVFVIDADTNLSPEYNLRKSLQEAVNNGLKLVICNSCDGLGIGRQLADIGVPHIVVMKEPIAVRVAVQFLEMFFTAFFERKTLQESVAIARRNLQLHEYKIDAASSSTLPRIIENPEESSLILPPIPPPPPDSVWEVIRKFSRKYQKPILVFLTLASFLLSLRWREIFSQDITKYSEISAGEEILLEANKKDSNIQAGVKAFGRKEYEKASEIFYQLLVRYPDNPEIRIYYNNARAALGGKKILKIATSVPIGKTPAIAQDILRGIAFFQEEVNNRQWQNSDFYFLQVIIANDDNDPNKAKEMAQKFVRERSIIAAIAHNSSQASEAAQETYIKGKLVAITPTSFSTVVSSDQYTYKMVPEMERFAKKLNDYAQGKIQEKKLENPTLLICDDARSSDNIYFAEKYRELMDKGQVSVVKDQSFNCQIEPESKISNKRIYEAIDREKVNILMIAPYVNDLKRAISVLADRPVRQRNILILGSPTFQTYLTIKEGQNHVEGLVIPVPWYDGEKERTLRTFWKNTGNVWRTPMAYDATKVITTGLRQLAAANRPLDRESLEKVLRDPSFIVEGMTGSVQFTPQGKRKTDDNPDRQFLILQIHNGQFVPVP